MVMGARGDRRNVEVYPYWQAMLSCMIVIIGCLFIAGLADPILYLMDKNLPEQTLSYIRQSTYKSIEKAPEAWREKLTQQLDKMKASDLTGIVPFLAGWLSKSIANGIMAFAVAAFLFRRKAKFDYSASDETIDDKF
jgi:hypothetical protein